jgi:hypothetical protein
VLLLLTKVSCDLDLPTCAVEVCLFVAGNPQRLRSAGHDCAQCIKKRLDKSRR